MARRPPQPDIEHYLDYLLSTAPDWIIDKVFQCLEGAGPGKIREILLSYAGKYSDLSDVPEDVWQRLGTDINEVKDEPDAYVTDISDESDREGDSVFDGDILLEESTFGRPLGRIKIGMGLEVWSDAQLVRVRPIQAQ
jgi:hypothetical protein